jgi:hypothetical protein
MSVGSFADSLRRGEFRKNESRYHLGKLKEGGYVLTDPSTKQEWKAERATKYILNCRFHYDTVALMIESGSIFIVDCMYKDLLKAQEVGNLKTCTVLVGTWWCEGTRSPLSLKENTEEIDEIFNELFQTRYSATCPICRFKWGVVEPVKGFQCGHFYHRCCLNIGWYKKFTECPRCSIKIKTFD